jgi:hypothetical protein
MADYIPSDNPDLIKRHEKRIKAKENTKKLTDFLSPILTKKFKKKLKEEEISEKPKLSTTKSMLGSKINRKAKKMTASEGSFARGGRATLKGGGICKKGMNPKARGKNS